MAKPTPDSVNKSLQQLIRGYQRDYAGRARASVGLESIERLIVKAKKLLKKARQLKGDRGRELHESVRKQLKLFVTERDAIAEAKFEAPELTKARGHSRLASYIAGRYRRNFAGRDRRTVDVTLLDELIADLVVLEDELRVLLEAEKKLEITSALNDVGAQLEMMRSERIAIEGAQESLSPEELGNRAGAQANQLMDAVRIHMAGHPRLSVDPVRARALIDGLERHATFLEAHPDVGNNAANAAVIRERLVVLEPELSKLDEAHAAGSFRERAGQLGAAANNIFALYKEHFAGQDRRTRNLRLAFDLCERLFDVERQMTALDERYDDDMNRGNLSVVRQRLSTYETESVAIAKARSEAQGGGNKGGDPLAGMITIDS